MATALELQNSQRTLSLLYGALAARLAPALQSILAQTKEEKAAISRLAEALGIRTEATISSPEESALIESATLLPIAEVFVVSFLKKVLSKTDRTRKCGQAELMRTWEGESSIARELAGRTSLSPELATVAMTRTVETVLGSPLLGEPVRLFVDEDVFEVRALAGHLEIRPLARAGS